MRRLKHNEKKNSGGDCKERKKDRKKERKKSNVIFLCPLVFLYTLCPNVENLAHPIHIHANYAFKYVRAWCCETSMILGTNHVLFLADAATLILI